MLRGLMQDGAILENMLNFGNDDIEDVATLYAKAEAEDDFILKLPVKDHSPSLFKDLFKDFISKAFEDFSYPYHEDVIGFEGFMNYLTDIPEGQLREAIDDILFQTDDISPSYLLAYSDGIHHFARSSNELQERLEEFYEVKQFTNLDEDKQLTNLSVELFVDIEDIICHLTKGYYQPYRYSTLERVINEIKWSFKFGDKDNIIDKDDLNDKDNISKEDNNYDDDSDDFENNEYDDIDEDWSVVNNLDTIFNGFFYGTSI